MMVEKIYDKVYGEEEIREPVLIELINSGSIQRLKEISQFGMPGEYYHLRTFSRKEHSIGVLILLRRMGANLEEQIAGLLHDVSHTAFSHVVDWIYGDPIKEDHQDNTLLETLENSEIPSILEKYGFNYRKIADMGRYSLLEQPAPSLCADRIDYTLREIALLHSKEDAIKIFKSLKNVDGKIVLTSFEAASLFADYYTKMNRDHWTGNEAKARFHILADALRKAIEEGIISFENLKKTDKEILDILNKSDNKEILDKLELLRKGFSLEKSSDRGIILQKKFRYIDPELIDKGEILNLSQILEGYKNILEEEKQNSLIKQKFLIVPIK